MRILLYSSIILITQILNGKMNFSSIEVAWMIHATEDEGRVIKRMVSLFPLSEENIKSSKLKGHFGNPVLLYKVRLTGAEADKFAQTLFSSINVGDRKKIRYELPKHLDEHGSLYVRISKQLLFENKIATSETDIIRIKLKLKGSFKPHEKLSYYRRLLK